DNGHDLSDLSPRLEPRAELAVLARALHRAGYADFPAGHITIRQPDDTFLHNPWGLDWDELRASDVIRIDKNANLVEGRGRVNPAILLHLELHQARGDIGVALHNHPRYATLWAIKRAVPPAYEQQGCYLRDEEIAVMDTYAGTVDKSDAARDNVEAVHGANIALLANHGVLVAGIDAAEAYTRALVLENRCRIAYLVEAGGGGFLMPDSGKEALQAAARRHKDVMGGIWWAHAIRRELRLDAGVLG